MTSLAVVILTHNEARHIGRALASVRGIASQVFVVDSGSTDRTIELAEAAGARVVNAPWLGGGKQKRLGEDACKHDWLLDLDADELVTAVEQSP